MLFLNYISVTFVLFHYTGWFIGKTQTSLSHVSVFLTQIKVRRVASNISMQHA